jgi:hypothetical protein
MIDPYLDKYFIYSDNNYLMPVKVLKRISSGYLCRHSGSMRMPLDGYKKKYCICPCKDKCYMSNLICLDERGFKKEIETSKGFNLVGY